MASQSYDNDTMAPQFVAQTRRTSNAPKIIVALAIVVIILAGAYFLGFNKMMFGSNTGYKAIFLTNGQVYFGKITRETSRDIYISDVYYIQVQDQVQPATTEGEQPKTVQVPTLLKRGDELHRPYGSMRINRDQMVVIENVGADSKILQQIQTMAGSSK